MSRQNINLATKTSETKSRSSKQGHINKLLEVINKAIENGATTEEALERLTIRQYDFLIECDVNLDNLILTTAQQKNLKEILKCPRPLFPNGYNKTYSDTDKIELHSKLIEFLKSQGAKIEERQKENFRDIDFTVNGKKYKIVFSVPRPEKKEK